MQGGSGECAPSGDLLQRFLKQNENVKFSNEQMEIGNGLHDRSVSVDSGLSGPSVVCSPDATISESYISSNHALKKSTESGNGMELKEDDKICSLEKVATNLGSRPLTDHIPKSNLLNSTKVKDEPYDHLDGCNLYGKDMNNAYSNVLSVKSEITMTDEPYENKVDDIRLRSRMKSFSSRKVFGSTSTAYEHPKPYPGCSILVSEPASLMNIKRGRKRKRTATYILHI